MKGQQGWIGLCMCFCAVVAIVGLNACTRKRDLRQNTVLVHIPVEPQNLHPTNHTSNYQHFILSQLYQRLVRVDIRNNQLIPELLDTLPALLSDSITVKLKLRKGPRWDNGQPISRADLIFSLKVNACVLTNNPSVRNYLKSLETIIEDPADSMIIFVKNKEPYFDFTNLYTLFYILPEYFYDPDKKLRQYTLAQLTAANLAQEAPEWLVQYFQQFNANERGREPSLMSGSGPYRLIRWDAGKSIELVRKPSYQPPDTGVYFQAYPERIIFTIEREMESVVLNLKKQNIDVSIDLSTAALVKLQSKDYFNAQYQSAFIPTYSYTYLGMNMRPDAGRTPFFTDVKVRKALAYLTPCDEIIAVLAKGYGFRQASFSLPMQADFDSTLKPLPFDPSKARSLLLETGWTDSDGDGLLDKVINGVKVPFRFELLYMLSPTTKDLSQILRNTYKKAGIDFISQAVDFPTYVQKATNHEFDAMLGAWSSSATAEDPSQIWHSRNWSNKGSNFVGYGSATSDSLIDKANLEQNPQRRKQMMQTLQRLIYDEQPYVFIFNPSRKVVVHKRFTHPGIFPEKHHVIINAMQLQSLP